MIEKLNDFFLRKARESICETKWFNSAGEAGARAKFKLLGVEHLEYSNAIGSRSLRPALIVECNYRGIIGRFSILIPELGEPFLIDESIETL